MKTKVYTENTEKEEVKVSLLVGDLLSNWKTDKTSKAVWQGGHLKL